MLHPRRAGRARLSPAASVLVVFALGAAATALAAAALRRTVAAEDRTRFEGLVAQAEDAVRDRLEAYVTTLRGAAGLFAARGGDVGPDEFAAYVRRLDLARNFPGIQGVGFARRVPAADVGRLEAEQRRRGDAGFRVWPGGGGAGDRFPVVYLEPRDPRNARAFGYDMFGEPARRAAMERARDTGRPAASGKVTLVQESEDGAQAGFLLYLPVYRGGVPPDTEQARRGRLLGFVYSPFRAGDLFAGIFADGRGPPLDFAAYDGPEPAPAALLHRSGPAPGTGSAPAAHVALDVAGRPWTLAFAARPEFTQSSGRRLVPLVAAGGLLVSAVLAGFAGAQARARVAAAEAARRAEGTLESITDGFFAVDRDWRLSYVNHEAERLLGRPRGELLGRHLWVEFPDLLATALGRNFRRAMAGGATAAFEEFYPPHGRWYEARAYGAADGVAVYFRDATERRRAEEALRRSEAFYRTLGDAVPDFLWSGGPGVGLEFTNQRWRDYTGLTVDELNARGWQSVLHPDDGEALAREFAEAGRAGRPFEAEVRLRRRDGEFRWFLARSVPTPAEGGVRWVGTLTDIHDRKGAEDALREADRSKDEFLAMLAHELRNPLAPLRNALLVLRGGAAAGPGLEALRAMMERQVEHLARLVDDLLDVSRLLRGKVGLRPAPVDLAEVVRRAAETAQPALDAHGHRLEVDLAAGPRPLRGDPVRLAQVLGNLLNNAAKYTDRPGVVRLEGRREGGEVVVRVRDEGVGIAPELLPRVFDLFVQGDRSAARSQGGLGIGLTLVRRLVEMHGGSVHAASDGPGRGSTFSVRLPAGVPDGSPPHAAAPGGGKAPPRRVLVVDDNVDAAESLALLLGAAGHEVRTAHDGPTALAAAAEFGPEAVVLDIGLPGMDGYEVARRLRAASGNGAGRPALIALTGYGQDEDRRLAREAGFDRHLVKPVDPAELEAALSATG